MSIIIEDCLLHLETGVQNKVFTSSIVKRSIIRIRSLSVWTWEYRDLRKSNRYTGAIFGIFKLKKLSTESLLKTVSSNIRMEYWTSTNGCWFSEQNHRNRWRTCWICWSSHINLLIVTFGVRESQSWTDVSFSKMKLVMSDCYKS